MGLLDKLLKGLGFEGEEEQIPKEPKKTKEKKQKQSVTASFNLNDDEVMEEKIEPVIEEINEESVDNNKTSETSLDFELIKLNTQVDAQNVIKMVKEGKRVLINIENLSPADITRSLDFITGALFALDKTMKKVDEKLYLIQ